MFIILLSIIGGIISLGIGAEMIVRSSVNLANIYKVSGYFIGFTVVALGTSLPELAATIQALSVVDSMEIALGNIIGSNIANILLILGVVSILQPIIFSEKKGQKNQTIMVLLITIIAAVIFYIVTNIPSSNPVIFGIILIAIFVFFLFFQYKMELDFKNEETFSAKYSQIFSYILLLIGLIFLYYGSKYFILGSNELAIYFQVPESIVGLTLVAFGTSLPELATGVVAALRRQSNIAVGTILGSNIYNIVGIFALILFLKPEGLPANSSILFTNIILMTLVTLLFVYKVRFGFQLFKIKPFHLGKSSGILFLILYLLYNFYNYIN